MSEFFASNASFRVRASIIENTVRVKNFQTLIVWLRRDLRLHDNAALYEACAQAKQIVPLFIFDPMILERKDTGAARVTFLIDALRVLDRNLGNLGGRLIVRHGRVPEELLRAIEEFDADGIFYHREYEPAGLQRDEAVAKVLKERGKVCFAFSGLTLFEPGEILTQAGTPYTVFSPYKRAWFSKPASQPLPAPLTISVPTEIISDPLPTAGQLRFTTHQKFESGGEDAAYTAHLEFVKTKIDNYDTERDFLACAGTSMLSRHLHLGTISPRFIVDYIRSNASDTAGRERFLSEIAWRDFYFQILLHFPHVTEGAFRPQFDNLQWENDVALFSAWKEGRTGYPIVDAAMRQMNAEAWMHNRGRMIVASFLTKDLLIDWRWGESYFMQKLVDGDQAANNGGWQWAAGTGTDAQPYFRIFNPTTQGEKFDPDGTYVKQWIPELRRVVHQPWKLSAAERSHLGCAEYPMPVVDHAAQRQKALAMYGKVTKI